MTTILSKKDLLDIDLMEELGITKLPVALQVKYTERMGEVLFRQIMIRVTDLLDPADAALLDKIISNPAADPDAPYTFLKEKIPHVDEVIEEEVLEFKKSNLDFMKQLVSM